MNMVKPIIGIVGKYYNDKETGLWSNNYASQALVDFINMHYAIPIIIPLHANTYDPDIDYERYDDIKTGPSTEDDEVLRNMILMCDGIILQGGTNSSYMEPRIAQLCMYYDIPLLGICAGFNNIARAIADVPLRKLTRDDNAFWHHCKNYADYRHHISISHDTYLYNLLNCKKISVNSIHEMVLDYDTVKDNHGIEVMAICNSDRTVEAFRVKDSTYTVALKWHPELMKANRYSNKILKDFIDQCNCYLEGFDHWLSV